ncbi:Uroporphyrinogen-III C-methyltransferase [Planctomycetes bacterium Pan216]|uniref:uroporphyrinogen-III C-methyltransferase n=1 Tax=Kolteria novifilia TaxID=2527975 RepID=A0A518BA92_9BACT|nr:Uroporphyrinogen-III C-methyltransferase [Planctomycetes bacterium Pan216]
MKSPTEGIVYLVGAGPGDPELITVAGRRLVREADCVVFDKLVDRRLVALAPPGAERIYVGKAAGSRQHTTPQSRINEIIIEKAREGKRVVRLKGGDPLLFARGAEEAECLQREGIPYAIVPGVTAALATAATASLPLTHRSCSSAVAFVTGHEDPAKAQRLDWTNLANFPGTLVVYMALTRIGSVAGELIRHGKDPKTPLALVEWGGTNRQQVLTTTLADSADRPSPTQLASPVIAIVGEICEYRERLGWFEKRPLFGTTILVPRPAEQVASTVDQLERLGARVLVEPLLRIEPCEETEPIDDAIARLDQFDWLVFTSRNGVTHFLDRVWEHHGDLRRLGRCRLAVIGPATGEALAEYHLRPDLVPEEFSSEGLARSLIAKGHRGPALLLRANRGREVLQDELRGADWPVETVRVYRQTDVEAPSDETRETLRRGGVDWVLLSSGNMARGFVRWIDQEMEAAVRQKTRLASISPITSAVIRELGHDVGAEASSYTLDGLVEAICSQTSRHGG